LTSICGAARGRVQRARRAGERRAQRRGGMMSLRA